MSSYLSVSASFCLSLSSLPHFLSLPIYPLLSFFLFFSFEFVLYILISNQLYHEEIGKGTIIDYILCSGIAGDPGLIPGLGRSPGEGKVYPLQYSSLENSMDYKVHGVAENQTQLTNFHYHKYFRLWNREGRF